MRSEMKTLFAEINSELHHCLKRAWWPSPKKVLRAAHQIDPDGYTFVIFPGEVDFDQIRLDDDVALKKQLDIEAGPGWETFGALKIHILLPAAVLEIKGKLDTYEAYKKWLNRPEE